MISSRWRKNADVEREFRGDQPIIKSTVLHNLSGEAANNPNNPFAAFDQVSLTPGISEF